MADIEQVKKIIPLITCEISFQSTCLRVGVWCQCNGFLILGSKFILSNNQSRATLSVRETCLIVGLRPLIQILITASLSSKTYSIALEPECVVFDGM